MLKDKRGIVVNLGLVPFLGLVLVFLALIAWAFHGYDIDIGIWEWSWLLVSLGSLLLTARMLGMNLWALIIVPIAMAALWYFGVMGGVI